MFLNLSQLRDDYKAIYKHNWAIAKKVELLIEVTKLEMRFSTPTLLAAKKIQILNVLLGAGITMRTLQRWKRNYRVHGLQSMMPKMRGHAPRKRLPKRVKRLIRRYRRKYRWGSEVLRAHLLRDHGILVNRYKIDAFIGESGLRKRYPCTTAKRVKAKKRRHTKTVVVHEPGKHTQVDVKYQLYTIPNGTKAFVYNFIDHASNWSYKRAYPAINEKNTGDFMERLLVICPFKIERLQTDNGIEFTSKWVSKQPDEPREHIMSRICRRENISHKLIPPGEKELQGLVERSHRQDDQELYCRISPENIKVFNELLEQYCQWRNGRRRFKKLLWLSPNIWLKLYNANKSRNVHIPLAEILRIAS